MNIDKIHSAVSDLVTELESIELDLALASITKDQDDVERCLNELEMQSGTISTILEEARQ